MENNRSQCGGTSKYAKNYERSILGIIKKDKVKNVDIRKETRMRNERYVIKKSKWDYVGHLARQEGRWTRKIMNGSHGSRRE